MRVIAVEEHYASNRVWDALGGVGRPAQAELEAKLLDVGEARITAMDAAGIDVQVLSHNPPGAQQLVHPNAVSLVREENDRLAEAISRYPSRLAAFAALPTADPLAAADELERAVRQLGFRGALIHGHTAGRFLDDQKFWPLFERAQALGMPIYIHPTIPPPAVAEAYYYGLAPQLRKALSTSAWGWHAETGLHVLRLIVAGVFDEFPGLQLVVGHLGEGLPFMLARTAAKLSEVANLPLSLQAYIQRNFHFTTSGIFSLPPLLNTLLEVGADRIMFAVDYPFSSNEQGRAFLNTMPMTSTDVEKVAHGNAERLLNL